MHKDINNFNNLTKGLFLVMALITGAVHWGKRNLTDTKVLKKIWLLIYDCLASGSISVFTGLIVYGYTNSVAYSLGVGGICGHLGNRFLNIVENALKQRLYKEEQKK